VEAEPANRRLAYQLGRGLEASKSYREAHRWYERAAVAGSRDAMGDLGRLYHGGLGVSRDYAEARRWLEKAAALGQHAAMGNLGVLYRDGHGVVQDYAEARRWFQKAAALGLRDAMSNLGIAHASGQGVPQDYAGCGYSECCSVAGETEGISTPSPYLPCRFWRRSSPQWLRP
jgi:uncharacterized protein